MTEGTGALGIIIERETPVPMRDGVILRANVFRPDAPGRFPAILVRTPYGKGDQAPSRYVRAGYAVVTQDSRGRYSSGGEYVLFTEENTGDAKDGYDTVEWLADQPWCNGRVGSMGASYNAWMQWQFAKLRPPHLVAMAAATIPTEIIPLDWPGAFRPGRRVRWWLTTIAPDIRKRRGLPPPHTKDEANEIWNELEQGRRLHFLPWMDMVRDLPPGLAEPVESWLRNPNRRPWRFREAHAEVEVPNLDFTGWFDHCNDTMWHLPGMQKNGRSELARTQTKMVIGPWFHGGLGLRKFGDIDFGPQAELDKEGMTIRWFDRWLKGLDNGVDREPPVRYFVMGAAKWRSAQTWPPEGTLETDLFLTSKGDAQETSGSGELIESAPLGDPCDTYVYDPNNPVSTLWSANLVTIPSDRRRLEYRRDILTYRTPPLEKEIEIVGYPEVALYASSSATDTDFFARLVDEDPDGMALEVCYGMVRARHRNSLDKEEFLTAGEVTEFRIKLGATACRFLKGHSVRLEITSSDFPNYDRNHNTGGNDLAETRMVPAEQKVFHSAEHPSRLILPVSPESLL